MDTFGNESESTAKGCAVLDNVEPSKQSGATKGPARNSGLDRIGQGYGC